MRQILTTSNVMFHFTLASQLLFVLEGERMNKWSMPECFPELASVPSFFWRITPAPSLDFFHIFLILSVDIVQRQNMSPRSTV